MCRYCESAERYADNETLAFKVKATHAQENMVHARLSQNESLIRDCEETLAFVMNEGWDNGAVRFWDAGGEIGDWVYVVTEDYEFVDRGLQRASDWIRYTIKAGTYPIQWQNTGGGKWNPDPSVATPGFIANTGPYYAVCVTDAVMVESYYENQLFSEIRGHREDHNETTTRYMRWYGYEIKSGDETAKCYLKRVN